MKPNTKLPLAAALAIILISQAFGAPYYSSQHTDPFDIVGANLPDIAIYPDALSAGLNGPCRVTWCPIIYICNGFIHHPTLRRTSPTTLGLRLGLPDDQQATMSYHTTVLTGQSTQPPLPSTTPDYVSPGWTLQPRTYIHYPPTTSPSLTWDRYTDYPCTTDEAVAPDHLFAPGHHTGTLTCQIMSAYNLYPVIGAATKPKGP